MYSVNDVFTWHNPRVDRYNNIAYMHTLGKLLNVPLPKTKPTSGKVLAKAMLTMQLKYGVEFVFCRPEDAGAKVIELLGGSEMAENKRYYWLKLMDDFLTASESKTPKDGWR